MYAWRFPKISECKENYGVMYDREGKRAGKGEEEGRGKRVSELIVYHIFLETSSF